MDFNNDKHLNPAVVLHWNYRGFTEFPLNRINGEEAEVTDIYLKENLITRVPHEICKLENLESLYLSGNDITELPKEISGLKCLKCLDLSGNRLARVPDEIAELRSLKFLILDENELTELPLRLNELHPLRYLSVCDNNLEWLPQRPVYNYYHCEFRFWRNKRLRAIPYYLWYHMFRDQQTRSLNIGCLNIAPYSNVPYNANILVKFHHDSVKWDIGVVCPPQHTIILDGSKHSPPSLYELCKRNIFNIISRAAQKLTENTDYEIFLQNYYNNSRLRTLQEIFGDININVDVNHNDCDENSNDNTFRTHENETNKHRRKRKSFYVPSDIVNEYFEYLPRFIRSDLCRGPVSYCEEVNCKTAIFDYVYYEFCLGKLILIDNVEDIILSATFCSKSCSDRWKIGKNVLPWTHV